MTIKSVAQDLEVNYETLRNWIRLDDAQRTGPPAATGTTSAAVAAALAGGRECRAAQTEPRVGRGTRHPAQGGQISRRGDALVNRFGLVSENRRHHDVKRLCQVIGLARSSYYYWKAITPDRAARATDDADLAVRIRVVHHESASTYGVSRITAELRDAGHPVNHKRVAWVMREIGLAGPRTPPAAHHPRRPHSGQGPGPART
ncbi:transposase [Saccharothrix sp. 6-C]|nr:transposase [Saccharothrix sp. 6-C]